MGGNAFCFKVCDPSNAHAADYCQHIYDRIGVQYTCPNSAQLGVFEACESENQDFPGVYVQNGVTMTYHQPPESDGPIQTMPYVARTPLSSNCVTFASSELFGQLPTPSVSPVAPGATVSGSGSGTGSGNGGSGSDGENGAARGVRAVGATVVGAGVVAAFAWALM